MKSLIASTALLAVLSATAPAQQPSATSTPGSLSQLNNSFANVFEKVAPTVVVIEARNTRPSSVPGLPEGLEFFLQTPEGNAVGEQPNIGSGFFFRPDGYILTNHHVVANHDTISVKLHDGRTFPAAVVGADERSDLAVLKIEGADFPVAALGDSDAVRVGEFAFAIGTPMDLPYTFTVGVVSAKGRNLQIGGGYEFIQTDASINPGNSGGPLCDIEGRVIGINALISGTNRGLGFSIPINTAKTIAGQLVATGHVARPWLGIYMADPREIALLQRRFPSLPKGVVVKRVEEGTPAESGGMRIGDIIQKVDGREVAEGSDLQHEILSKKIGDTVDLDIWRSGRLMKISVTTEEQPANPLVRVSTTPRRKAVPQDPSVKRPQPSSPGFSYAEPTVETLQQFGLKPRQNSGGLIVTEVEEGSPAAVAGLEPGDILTEAAGRPLLSSKDLESILSQTDPDRGILLLLERNNHRTFAILKP